MIFKRLLVDFDMEVRCIAISKIPDIAQDINTTLFELNIFSEFETMVNDHQFVFF